jgi:hypothetical protein
MTGNRFLLIRSLVRREPFDFTAVFIEPIGNAHFWRAAVGDRNSLRKVTRGGAPLIRLLHVLLLLEEETSKILGRLSAKYTPKITESQCLVLRRSDSGSGGFRFWVRWCRCPVIDEKAIRQRWDGATDYRPKDEPQRVNVHDFEDNSDGIRACGAYLVVARKSRARRKRCTRAAAVGFTSFSIDIRTR